MGLSSTPVYTDLQSLTSLKARAVEDAAGSLDEVARQFESLFVQQMVKSMRQASLGEGLMDNDQSLLYRDMYDQQLSLHLSENGGIGLADVLKRQLGDLGKSDATHSVKGIEDYQRQVIALAKTRNSASSVEPGAVEKADSSSAVNQESDSSSWSSSEFVEQLLPIATEAASLLGIKPHALLAQAALETGWGKHVMRDASGQSANNLFGIKADQRWDGERVAVDSLEYEGGVAAKKRAHFRSYESFADSFQDYVDFVKSNPRYSEALKVTADSDRYFTELQRAGYATDPNYANKIKAVMDGPEMTQAIDRLKTIRAMPL